MPVRRSSLLILPLLVVFAAGCTPATPPAEGRDERPVRDAFTAFQAALKAHDGDKLWELIDADSQAGAERAGKAVNLSGKDFVKSDHFGGQKQLDELPGGKIEKVSVQGDKATVNYVEADGDHEKLKMVREGGQWKVSAPIP
jgi:hypothetical protein